MSYLWLKPQRKRRQLFDDDEYKNAMTIEEAYWMRRQETAFFSLIDMCEFIKKCKNAAGY